MSLIKPALWAEEFDEPMPEGTTYWDFAYKREKKWVGEDIKDQLALIEKLEAIAGTDKLSEYITEQKQELTDLYKKKIKLEVERTDYDG